MPVAKKKSEEKATIPVKLNLTPSELALVQEACEIQHARRHGPWIRDAALEVARKVVAEKKGGKK